MLQEFSQTLVPQLHQENQSVGFWVLHCSKVLYNAWVPDPAHQLMHTPVGIISSWLGSFWKRVE